MYINSHYFLVCLQPNKNIKSLVHFFITFIIAFITFLLITIIPSILISLPLLWFSEEYTSLYTNVISIFIVVILTFFIIRKFIEEYTKTKNIKSIIIFILPLWLRITLLFFLIFIFLPFCSIYWKTEPFWSIPLTVIIILLLYLILRLKHIVKI